MAGSNNLVMLEDTGPRVTIGITMYNSSEYVDKCLDSLLTQTFPHHQIEIICVDDGSSDDTIAKAKHFENAAGWGSFRILTQENTGGPAIGRNRVMDEAQGKYIFFVDVDDYLGKEALASMVQIAESDHADVILGRFVGVRRGVPKYIFRETLARTDITKTTLMDSMNVLKMFRTAYVRELGYRFNPRITIAEDHPFSLAAYANTDRIAIQGDEDCYFWVRHESSQGKALHLTGHYRDVADFYAYMHESFGVLGFALARGHKMAEESRRSYWNRLLTLDIPNEILRRKDSDIRESIDAAKELTATHGAAACAEFMTPRANLMLGALLNTNESYIREVARMVRA